MYASSLVIKPNEMFENLLMYLKLFLIIWRQSTNFRITPRIYTVSSQSTIIES